MAVLCAGLAGCSSGTAGGKSNAGGPNSGSGSCTDSSTNGPVGPTTDGFQEALGGTMSSGAVSFSLASCSGAFAYEYNVAQLAGQSSFGGPTGNIQFGTNTNGAMAQLVLSLPQTPQTGTFTSAQFPTAGNITLVFGSDALKGVYYTSEQGGSWTLTITSVALAPVQPQAGGALQLYTAHGSLQATAIGTGTATLNLTF